MALAFLALLPCALFLPGLLSGRMLYGFDTNGTHIPFHAEVLRCLAAHQWPLWLNGVLGGMPGIAACNLEFLYPTDFVGSLCGLPFWILGGCDAIVHVALAGLGMFLLLRRLGRSVSGSLLGALFFATAGSELSQVLGGYYNMMEGVAWAPWALWAAHKAREERSLFAWGLCGAAFAMQILADAAQIFAYTLPVVACLALAPGRSPRADGRGLPASGRALAGLALSLVLAFLLSAPQLWLTLQYLPQSARHGYSHADFVLGSISLPETLTWWIPGLFGWQNPTYHGLLDCCFSSEYFGLLPWALAAGAVCSLWRRELAVRWLAALALAAFFFAQRQWTPFYPVLAHLPVLSGFRDWHRALFLVTLAVCGLAAYGWDALRAAQTRTAALGGAAAFGLLALTATAYAWGLAKLSAEEAAPYMPWIAGGAQHTAEFLTAQARDSVSTAWALIAGGSLLLWLSTKRFGTGAALALALAFHAVDLSSMATRFIRFVDPTVGLEQPVFTPPAPPGPGLEPWRVFDPGNPVMLLGYENLGGAASVPLRSYLLTQTAMQAVPGRWKDWADLMGVRYVFSHSQGNHYLPGDRVTVYENRGAFPRAWLVGKSVQVNSEDAGYGLLADPRFHARDEVALNVDAGLKGPAPLGGVRWLARSPQAFSLDVSTDRDAALVLSNAWYPSWKADIDGQDAPVLKADGGLQAVLVKAGRHQVGFRFDPGLFYDALAACLAGLAALAGLLYHDAQARGKSAGEPHAR